MRISLNSQEARLVNLTPHDINIVCEGGTVTLPKTGQVARVSQETKVLFNCLAEGETFTISSTEPGEVAGLPEAEDGVIYVVSAQVRLAVPERVDVWSPGDLVRGEDGQPVGCKGFFTNQVKAPVTRERFDALCEGINLAEGL